MKTPAVIHEVQSSGHMASAEFGISQRHAAKIMGILRSTLYTRKALAVLREYGANAWDEHRESGQPERPIWVQMPSHMRPVLKIRDFGRGLSQDQVLNLYTQYGETTKDATNNATGMMGIGCLLKGQPVVTLDGMKPIENVRVGDWVLTHKGRFRQVTEIMRRPYKGRAFRVYLSQTTEPLVLTEEHPILTGDHKGNTAWTLPGDIQAGYRSAKKGIRAWNTYATLPATLDEGSDRIAVLPWLDGDYSFGQGCCTRQKVFTNSRSGKTHRTNSTRTTKWAGFPEWLILDEQVGWLLGLFAAEGSTTPKQVTLSLNIGEQDLAARFITGMQDRFAVTFKPYPRPERNLLELVAHHTALACLLKNLCGARAANKRVPEVVMQGTQGARVGFLRGVLDGDGSSTRPRFTFGVASPKLAWGVRTLMSVTEGKWGTVGTMENHPNRWSVHYNREASWSYAFRQGDYLLRPILKTEAFDLDSEVFNFSVEEDESYVSNFILHNCKAGFAYADQFTITSWHGGMKSVYVAVLDKSNKGRMDKMFEEPCGDETGIEIQVAIKPTDVDEFQREARGLFRYFNPQPKIDMHLPTLPSGMPSGFILESKDDGWIAVMGCIPYRLDLAQMKDQLTGLGLWECLEHLAGGVYVPIGGVEFSASREELQYTEVTIKAIGASLRKLMDEYVADAMSSIQATNLNGWDRRLKAAFLLHVLKFPLPRNLRELADNGVLLYSRETSPPKTFKLVEATFNHTYRVNIRLDARILIQDDQVRRLKGWRFQNHHDVLAVPNEGCTYEQVEAEVQEFAKAAGIDGVPIAPLSSRAHWSNHDSASGKRRYAANQKHKDRTFTLNTDFRDTVPRSKQWTSAVPPEGDHLFVIVSEFSPGGTDLLAMQNDQRLLEANGIEWPVIYGYKTTESKPVKRADIENGTHYLDWRTKTVAALITDAVKDTLRDIAWAELFTNMPWEYSHTSTDSTYVDFRAGLRDLIGALTHDLGEKHPVTRYFAKNIEARREIAKLAKGRTETVQKLAKAAKYNPKRSATEEWFHRLVAAYPMIGVVAKSDRDFGVFHPKRHYNAIVSYIIDCDKLVGGSTPLPEA